MRYLFDSKGKGKFDIDSGSTWYNLDCHWLQNDQIVAYIIFSHNSYNSFSPVLFNLLVIVYFLVTQWLILFCCRVTQKWWWTWCLEWKTLSLSQRNFWREWNVFGPTRGFKFASPDQTNTNSTIPPNSESSLFCTILPIGLIFRDFGDKI